MIEGDDAVSEYELGIWLARNVCPASAAIGFQFIAKIADIPALEGDRRRTLVNKADGFDTAIDEVEDGVARDGRSGYGVGADKSGFHIVADRLGQRTTGIAHERIPALPVRMRTAIEPECRLGATIQNFEARFGWNFSVELAAERSQACRVSPICNQ